MAAPGADGGRRAHWGAAAEVGASRRYLATRFGEQVGLAPKTAARLLRFADVRRRIEVAPACWAEIAFDVGYADQSHLNRDFRQLAGTTPTDFVARLIRGGGVVGDGCAPAAQGSPLTQSRALRLIPLSKTDPGFAASVPGITSPSTRGEVISANIIPALRYRDADAGVEFLKSAFGAEEKEVFRDDEGVIRHAELRLGAGLVMVGQAAEDGWLGGEPARPLASTVSLYVVVEDPDAHHERAVVAGAKVVRPLEDTEYGSREHSVRDPEGNL